MSFLPLPAACEGCPAQGIGFLPPGGPPDSQLILIGTGPTESQAYKQERITDRMNRWLSQAGIPNREIMTLNLVQCWLPARRKPTPDGTREPTRKEVNYCWQAHVRPILNTLRPAERRVLIPVGLPASRFLLGLAPDGGVEKYLGTIQEVEIP